VPLEPFITPIKSTLPIVTSPTVSSSSSSSSRGSVQIHFAHAVCQRDGYSCIVCNNKCVEAAHVVPVGGKRAAEAKRIELLNVYDTNNGITLCTICHDYFDNGLWCIDIEGDGDYCDKLIVSVALSSNDADWKMRNGALVRLPSSTLRHYWPTSIILSVQHKFFQAQQESRKDMRLNKPVGCHNCGLRFVSRSTAFHKHISKCNVQKYPSANFHTPIKLDVNTRSETKNKVETKSRRSNRNRK
jgi:hypothetical protein